jgi:serine/threonine protein kinase
MSHSTSCPACQAQNAASARFCTTCGARLALVEQRAIAARTAPPPQQTIFHGRYAIAQKLSESGSGALYRANDLRFSALTWMIQELNLSALDEPLQDQQAHEAFHRAVKKLLALSHPNLTRIADYFEQDGKAYLVMELVLGETLASLVQREGLPLPLARVLPWAGQLCGVLGYLHSQKPPIIMGNLTPANMLLTPQGQLILVDFGIAGLLMASQAGDAATVRSDIYALGALLHYLLTGYQVEAGVTHLPPAAQLNPELPLGISETLATATDSDTERRFPSMRAFYQRLEPLQHLVTPDGAVSLDPFTGIPGVAKRPDAETRELQAPRADNRVINAWVEGLPEDEPLQLDQTYELSFNVDTPRAGSRSIVGGISDLIRRLPREEQQVAMLVVLDTDDFAIDGDDQQTLIVPRKGTSKNSVRFAIRPKHSGPGVIRALFFANNRMFQKMTIELQVGEMAADAVAIAAQSSGITLDSTLSLPPRQPDQTLNLTIIKKEAGYQIIAQNSGVARASLNLSETKIAELIAQARDVLKSVVYTEVNDGYIYQGEDTSIPADIHAASLMTLAELGYYLYQELFYAPGNGPDAHAIGTLLRQLSQQGQLSIKIAAERFVFPWALLYDRDPLDPDHVDPEGFWGFKHIVEHMPEFSYATTVSFDPRIVVGEKLGLGFVCNTTIDTQLSRPIVKAQRDFLATLPGISLSDHPNCQDLYDLLNDADAPRQLLYFYCHAESNLPGDPGGVAGSKMLLSDSFVRLLDLKIRAPTSRLPLKQAPLVFLNACQSAELSPYLYDGLVPYMVAKGARGVIGSEVNIPAFFAAEFAQELLRRFIGGDQPLGALLLGLRREYLMTKNNVLGLVYALYCSGDMIVQRMRSN